LVYVSKFPWSNDAGEKYWKYIKRPHPDFEDYEMLRERSKLGQMFTLSVETFGKTLKYKSNSVEDVQAIGVTYDYQDIYEFKYQKGRGFNKIEEQNGTNNVIIGHLIAEALYGNLDPIGRSLKMLGQKYTVIGVLETEGDSEFNFISYDEVAVVPYNNIRRHINISDKSPVWKNLAVKAKPGVPLKELKGEMASLLRRSRKLKPIEGNNFSLNEMTAIVTAIEGVMGALNFAGIIIGFFSLVIGMFSVANIMFVSSHFADFPMSLSIWNITLGIIVSVIVGIISGIVPAWMASRLDPVVAMRG